MATQAKVPPRMTTAYVDQVSFVLDGTGCVACGYPVKIAPCLLYYWRGVPPWKRVRRDRSNHGRSAQNSCCNSLRGFERTKPRLVKYCACWFLVAWNRFKLVCRSCAALPNHTVTTYQSDCPQIWVRMRLQAGSVDASLYRRGVFQLPVLYGEWWYLWMKHFLSSFVYRVYVLYSERAPP